MRRNRFREEINETHVKSLADDAWCLTLTLSVAQPHRRRLCGWRTQTMHSLWSSFRDVLSIKTVMGEWKAQISLRVRQALRTELEEFAAREKRKLGNIGELILEWGFEQLKAAGSIDRLLKYKIRTSAAHPKQR